MVMRLALRMLLAITFGVVLDCAVAAGPVLGMDDARHLLVRTSFAASAAATAQYARLTRKQAADELLSGRPQHTIGAPPLWTGGPFESLRRFRDASREERQQLQRQRREQGLALRAWWLDEMRRTPSPLTEKMVLFWHNHFVSSDRKVRSPQLMYRQNALLRRHALGSFAVMLHEIARDPAMVIYLDNASNRKGQPNENFAREVMELFTLGEGHYTESDVKEAARAFTGWGVDPDRGEFTFRSALHDDGYKAVLGRGGYLDGDEVLDILLAQPSTSEHIVEKLWREFVSPDPEPVEVRRIAREFRESGYDIKVALRALLTSDAFYAPEHRATLIKSPVELIIGTLRQFDFAIGEMQPFALRVAQLGQDLFAPANVKGWPGGEAWINSTTLLARKALLERLFTVEATQQPDSTAADGLLTRGAPREGVSQAGKVSFDSAHWQGQFEAADVDALQRAVLVAAPAKPIGPGMTGLQVLQMMTQDAVYQLK